MSRIALVTPESEDMKMTWTLRSPSERLLFVLPEVTLAMFKAVPDSDMMIVFKRDIDGVLRKAWPRGVRVLLNDQKVPIGGGHDDDDAGRAKGFVYVKDFCRTGTNVLMITSDESRKFILSLQPVQCATLDELVTRTIRQRTLPDTDATTAVIGFLCFINRHRWHDQPPQTSVLSSFICPVSGRRIACPARGRTCMHLQCFDLEKYIETEIDRESWRCPICEIPTRLDDLIVDGLLLRVLRETGQQSRDDEKIAIVEDCRSWSLAPNIFSQRGDDDEQDRLRFPVQNSAIFSNLWIGSQTSMLVERDFHLLRGLNLELCFRPDLDVEFQCLVNDCSPQNPLQHGVVVSVNGQHLKLDWSRQVDGRASVDVKRYLKEGTNSLAICHTAACAEKHTYSLHLVHRPAIRTVVDTVILRDYDLGSRAQVRRLLTAARQQSEQAGHEPQVVTDGLPVSVVCPISKKRIAYPARLGDCQHIQCFDLISFLKRMADIRQKWKCPICNIKPSGNRFKIDAFIWSVLDHMKNSDAPAFVAFENGTWQPLYPPKEDS